jgi:hypothetical protein
VLDEYGVPFEVTHGHTSTTVVHDAAEVADGRPLIVLYVGDWDPSGLHMSEVDLPKRLKRYGGDHVILKRIALVSEDLPDLPSVCPNPRDTRTKWFRAQYGERCYELDAMRPNDLRQRVEEEIVAQIEPEAWDRCARAQEAEQQSLEAVLDRWPTTGQ